MNRLQAMFSRHNAALKPRSPEALSQAKLATAVQVSRATISKYANDPGAAEPWLKNRVEKYLRGLGMDPALLYTRQEAEMEPLDFGTLTRFGLTRHPFQSEIRLSRELTKDGAADIYMTGEMRKAQPFVVDAIMNRGFVAVASGPYLGKTAFIASVLYAARSDPRKVKVARCYHPDRETLSAGAIYDSLVYDLGEPDASNPKMMKEDGKLQEAETPRRRLEARARQIKRLCEDTWADYAVVLIVEEAHKCQPQTLSALKQLYDLGMEYGHMVGIVLVGQTPLAERIVKLGRASARDLVAWRTNADLGRYLGVRDMAMRTTLVPITGLRAGEVAGLVEHKIVRAGGDPGRCFSPEALAALHKHVDTIPACDDVYAMCDLPYPVPDKETARWSYYHVCCAVARAMMKAARSGRKGNYRVEVSDLVALPKATGGEAAAVAQSQEKSASAEAA